MARPSELRTCSAIKCTQDYIKFIRIRNTGRGRQAGCRTAQNADR
jgi:hypothetical protein